MRFTRNVECKKCCTKEAVTLIIDEDALFNQIKIKGCVKCGHVTSIKNIINHL